MSNVRWFHVNLLWDLAWNDLSGCRTEQLNYLSKREYLWDLAAPLHSRYAAQSGEGDARLHFTGPTHGELSALTHTLLHHTHRNTCVTLCPWLWQHQQSTFFLIFFKHVLLKKADFSAAAQCFFFLILYNFRGHHFDPVLHPPHSPSSSLPLP